MEEEAAYEFPDSNLVSNVGNVLRARLRKRGVAICVSGIDGSGKTTLARALVKTFQASGIPVKHLHLYEWYLNVLTTPILLQYNRYFGRKLLVFDRNIFDNLAVASARQSCPRWLSNGMLSAVSAYYPRFDYRFCLVIGFAETLLRRPGSTEERFMALSGVYEEIALRVRYTRLASDRRLLVAALGNISAAPAS